MKKLIVFSVIFLAFHLAGNAQNAKFGITGGVSIANYHSSSNDPADNGNSKIGLTAGLLVDIPLGNMLSFQPAINFVQKGTKDEQTTGGVTAKASLNVNAIEVPLNLLLNFGINKGNFFIGAGPSVAFGISGKLKYDDGSTVLDEGLKFGNSDEDDLRGLDFGANFLAGYSCGSLLFSANYNAGLTNMIPGDSGGDKIKSHYFGIRLGYLLNNNARK